MITWVGSGWAVGLVWGRGLPYARESALEKLKKWGAPLAIKAEEARHLADLAARFPEIDQALVRCAQVNAKGALSSRDFKALGTLGKLLEEIDTVWEEAQKAQEHLQFNGLATRMHIAHQANSLDATTPLAPSSSPARRI